MSKKCRRAGSAWIPFRSGSARGRWLAAVALAGLGACAPAPEPVAEGEAGLPTHLWKDATAETIGETAEWSNKLELADINGDGMVDLLFANGGKYNEPGEPEMSRVFLNQGAGKPFVEATETVFGSEGMLSRAIKARDVNGDGHVDVLFSGTYQTMSRLMLGAGDGTFTDASETHLPAIAASVGDVEFGDADLDGDLDLLLADWGPGDPMENDGGRAMLWLNDGEGHFTDATAECMPETLVKFSWDAEFVDVDNDFDLDVVVSSKKSEGSFLYENDGTGHYADVTEGRLPPLTNNYEWEPMDLNGDGFLDTVTINDGGLVEGQRGSHRESVFLADGEGGFTLATGTSLPDAENLGYDDNRILYLDFDNDGDADVLVGSLSGPDRVLVNDGKGHFTVATEIFTGPETKGTLDLALADLDGDHKLDAVMSQGEFAGFEREHVFLADQLAADTTAPRFGGAAAKDGMVMARWDDGQSPNKSFQWSRIVVVTDAGEVPMEWYGEHLWQAAVAEGATPDKTCATDAAGNEACHELP